MADRVLRVFVPFIIAAALAVPIVLMVTGYWSDPNAAFFVFAALPSVVGLLHHVSSERRRFEESKADLESRTNTNVATTVDRFQPTAAAALTSCLILYAVFLLAALLASVATTPPAANASKEVLNSLAALKGLVLAGYGAYVSVLWYMLGRINANALSARFIVNSAIKVAAAMVIGYVAAMLNLFGEMSGVWAQGALFLIGLFQAWAMGYLRQKAVEVFGVKQAAAEDLPLSLIEGIDDSAADLLAEHGISTVQHLATYDPVELSFRTLYPLDRTLDWVDQAILTLEFGPVRIAALRDWQIRTTSGFVMVYRIATTSDDATLKAAAADTLKGLAQKMGLAEPALLLKGEVLEKNRVVDVIEALWNKPAIGSAELLTTAPKPLPLPPPKVTDRPVADA